MDPTFPQGPRLARLAFAGGGFEVLAPGEAVLCAVTGAAIPLDELRYWNVAAQEAYASAEIACRRDRELSGGEGS